MSLALRHHLSGNPSCPHARKFIRLTDTLASSKRCTYSYGHILQCWGLMEHNLFWVGCNTILLFSSSPPVRGVYMFIIFLLRMIFLLTKLVRMIDIYSFNASSISFLILFNACVFAYICFKDSFAQGCLLLIFFLCITNRESLYKVIP